MLRCALIMAPLFDGSNCASPSGTPSRQTTPSITNHWRGPGVDPTRLPIGDKYVSRTAPAVGHLYQCTPSGPPRPAGAEVAGPWLNQQDGTWDLTRKVTVKGSVKWPTAEYGESVSAGVRTIVTNGLPVKTLTGTFPIAPSDPAYAYDRNPNSIESVALRYDLPVSPPAAQAPSCLPMGPVGLLRNGVALFASVDESGRDAVAWETQDDCQGHPQQQGEYHYHDISACLRDAARGPSTLIGWAADGFPLVVERDDAGNLPTNADLDACHGRTAAILLDGNIVETYHYSATLEFPYIVGCFRGSPVSPAEMGRR